MAIETPIDRHVARPSSSAAAGQEADAVVDPGQRGTGHVAGPVGAVGEDPVELGRVVEQGQGAVAERRGGLDDHVGDVLLEVAVAAARVVVLELGDRPAASAR